MKRLLLVATILATGTGLVAARRAMADGSMSSGGSASSGGGGGGVGVGFGWTGAPDEKRPTTGVGAPTVVKTDPPTAPITAGKVPVVKSTVVARLAMRVLHESK